METEEQEHPLITLFKSDTDKNNNTVASCPRYRIIMPPIRYTLPNNNNSNKNIVGLAAAAAAAAKKKAEDNSHDDAASRDKQIEQVPIKSTETAAAVAATATAAAVAAKEKAEDNENHDDEAGRDNKNGPVPIIKFDEAAVAATAAAAAAATTVAADYSTPTAAAAAAVRAVAKVKAKQLADKLNQTNVTTTTGNNNNNNENKKTGGGGSDGGGDGSDTYWRYVDNFMEEMDPSIRDGLPLRYQPKGASASLKENIFFEILFHPKKLGIMLSTRNDVRNVVVANTKQGGNYTTTTNSDATDDDDNKAVVVSKITNELYKNRVILGDEVVSINNINVMNQSLCDITNMVLSTTERPISITFLRTISTTIPQRFPDNKTGGGNDSAWRYVDNFMEVMDPLIRDSLPLRYQPAAATSKENIFFEILFRPKKLGIVLSERKNKNIKNEKGDHMKQNDSEGDVSVIVSSISNELYKNRVALGDEIVSINDTNVMNKSLYIITNMILSTKKRPISITFLRTTTIQKAVRSSSLVAMAAAAAAAAPDAVPPPTMMMKNEEMGKKNNEKYQKSESKNVEITKKQWIEYETMKYMVDQMKSIMVKARDAKNTYDKRAFVESVCLAISDDPTEDPAIVAEQQRQDELNGIPPSLPKMPVRAKSKTARLAMLGINKGTGLQMMDRLMQKRWDIMQGKQVNDWSKVKKRASGSWTMSPKEAAAATADQKHKRQRYDDDEYEDDEMEEDEVHEDDEDDDDIHHMHNSKPLTKEGGVAHKNVGGFSSRYRGVSKSNKSSMRKNPWRAQVSQKQILRDLGKADKQSHYVGCFATEVEAAKAYDDFVIQHYHSSDHPTSMENLEKTVNFPLRIANSISSSSHSINSSSNDNKNNNDATIHINDANMKSEATHDYTTNEETNPFLPQLFQDL